MIRRAAAAVLFAAILMVQPVAAEGCSYPVNETGVDGEEVRLESPPERVVSLGPSITQTVWELNASSKVVGIDSHSTYLNATRNLTDVGKFNYDASRIVNLTPDLVLAANVTTATGVIPELRRADLEVYMYGESRDIESIYEKVNTTARLVGRCREAVNVVDGMKETVRKVERLGENKRDPRVLHVLGSSGYVAGNGTFIGSVLTKAGGRNVAAESGIEGYREMGSESLVERDPEWISLPEGVEVPNTPGFENTEAVKNGQVVHVNGNYISQPAPRVVVPLKKLAESYRPERYDRVFGNGSGESERGGSGTSKDGFGVVAALVGIAVFTYKTR